MLALRKHHQLPPIDYLKLRKDADEFFEDEDHLSDPWQGVVPKRDDSGVLDTFAYIDLAILAPASLPKFPEITSITLAELHQGVAMAKDAQTRAARIEKLGVAVADFEPMPLTLTPPHDTEL